jgi:arginine utilization protein RocB
VQERHDYELATRKFYPYISDLSYCGITEDEGALASLTDNMPAWPKKYSLPVEDIRSLNVPAVNIGPYGKEPHQFGERVHRDYTFNVMPELLYYTVKELLGF